MPVTDDIPTVDISDFLSPSPSPTSDKEAAAALLNAYEVWGFVYVSGWEALVPAELVDRVFKYNELFFDLPLEKKEALAYTTPEANRGYIRAGRENAETDQKETYENGGDLSSVYPEHWPEEEDIPGFKATVKEFHDKAHGLNLALMRLLSIALGLEKEFFHPHHSQRANNLRMLHYPSTSRVGKQSRLIPHTDDGTITLLWQDFTGGLEVESPSGEWVHAVPRPGTLLVNIADLLQFWSNDKLKSTRHRAVLPPLADGEDPNGTCKTRRSLAFFINPDPDTLIEPLSVFGEPKYAPVIAKEFYAGSLGKSIGKY